MRISRLLLAALALAWMALFFPPSAGAAEFTAEIVITGPGADPSGYELFVKGPLYRLRKTRGPLYIPPFPTIVNEKTGVTRGLNPQARQYVEMGEIEKTIMMNPLAAWAAARKGMTEKPGPVETVNGYECDTFLYVEPGKSDAAAKTWVSRKLDRLIREERYGLNGTQVLELRNIEEKPVDGALFEIPPGYTRMDAGGKTPPGPPKRPSPQPAASPSPGPGSAPTAGETVERTADLSDGRIRLKSLRNGGPQKASVAYFREGEAKPFHSEQTHPKTGVIERKLPPGRYTIKVTDSAVVGKPSVVFEGVEIPPGQVVEKTAVFTAGELVITASLNGEPVSAPVEITDEQGERVFRNATNWPRKGTRVVLLPEGVYTVTVKNPKGQAVRFDNVPVAPGASKKLAAELTAAP